MKAPTRLLAYYHDCEKNAKVRCELQRAECALTNTDCAELELEEGAGGGCGAGAGGEFCGETMAAVARTRELTARIHPGTRPPLVTTHTLGWTIGICQAVSHVKMLIG